MNGVKKLPTTGKISLKQFRCESCEKQFQTETNHWGSIYATPCCGYGKIGACLEPCPAGYTYPEKWTMVSLGDILDDKVDVDPEYKKHLVEHLQKQGIL